MTRSSSHQDTAGSAQSKAEPTVLDAALSHAAQRGWFVFPARFKLENGKWQKLSWKSAEYADGRKWGMTTDPNEIQCYFTEHPDAVGVVTGKLSGIFVLETDTVEGHGVDGDASLQQLEAEHGPLPDTLTGQSPSRSKHRYYKYPDGYEIGNSESVIGPGVDVRAEGGMVIAPPSMRPDGGKYIWLNDHPVADPPQWLIDLIARPPRSKPKNVGPLPDWILTEEPEGLEPGTGRGIIDDDNPNEIEAALSAIDPDLNRRGWIAIGCALLKRLGEEEGLEKWNEWSSRGGKYPGLREMQGQWRSIVQKDGYGWNPATLFWHASQADPNWRDRYEEEAEAKEEEAEEEDEAKAEFKFVDDEPKAKSSEDSSTQEEAKPPTRVKTSAEFVDALEPPSYLIDEMIQRGYLYSLTAPTGWGKTSVALLIAAHVALGNKLGKVEVERGKVLILCGENPDDVRMRWIVLCELMGVDHRSIDVFFWPEVVKLSDDKIRWIIECNARGRGPFALIIVDTAAAYFEGDEENQNVQYGSFARMLRTYTDVEGGPTVIVTCHPVKNYNVDALVPRGGGAFVNEVDGNLVCLYDRDTMTVTLTWHCKIRGVDFEPMLFKLLPRTNDRLKTAKGRQMWSIAAQVISKEEKETLEAGSGQRLHELLLIIVNSPGLSLADMARRLNLFYRNGEPDKTKVHRMLKVLTADGLVKQQAGRWTATAAGRRTARDRQGGERDQTF